MQGASNHAHMMQICMSLQAKQGCIIYKYLLSYRMSSYCTIESEMHSCMQAGAENHWGKQEPIAFSVAIGASKSL